MKFIKDIINSKKIAEERAKDDLGISPMWLGQEDRADHFQDGGESDVNDTDSPFVARLDAEGSRRDDDEVEDFASFDPAPDVEKTLDAVSIENLLREGADDPNPAHEVDKAQPEKNPELVEPAAQTETHSIFPDNAIPQGPEPADCIQTNEMAQHAAECSLGFDTSEEPIENLFRRQTNSNVMASGRDPALDEAPIERDPVAADPIVSDGTEDQPATSSEIPKPQRVGRSAGRSGRVKTRLLGFSGGLSVSSNPFGEEKAAPKSEFSSFPLGWLVVTNGPGKGAAFPIFEGLTQIGRGEEQTIRLNFGDNSISRENHASIAYDAEQRQFYLGHGGKTNLVRLNGRPVLSTEELSSKSQLRIGETTLRFVALCGDDFSWDEDDTKDVRNARIG